MASDTRIPELVQSDFPNFCSLSLSLTPLKPEEAHQVKSTPNRTEAPRLSKYCSQFRLVFVTLLTFHLVFGSLSLVSGYEFNCEPVKGCFCDTGPDGQAWEIQCPAALVQVHNITLKVIPFPDKTARFNVDCDPNSPLMAWNLVEGLDFVKEETKYNVTRVHLNYCTLSNSTLSDFFHHVNLRNNSILSFSYVPSPFFSSNSAPTSLTYFVPSLQNLQVLDLKQAGLTSIPDLTSLPNLQELHLRHNLIRSIPSRTFESNPNLKWLDLSYNDLQYLTPGSLPPSLQHLSLSKNNISILTKESLSNLKALEILVLTWNPLTEIDPLAFSQLRELRTLHLDSTQINLFPTLRNLPKLVEVSISHRDHQTEVIQSSSLIRSTQEPLNKPPISPEAIKATTTTRSLNSGGIDPELPNSTTEDDDDHDEGGSSTPPGQGQEDDLNVNVEPADDVGSSMSVSRPPQFEGTIRDLPSLTELKLSHDGLIALPELLNLPNLTSLKLNGNQIKNVPPRSFNQVPSLTLLDLSHNLIEELGLIHAFNLESLDLSYNQIQSLNESVFSTLRNLKVLRISYNKIRFIHSRAFFSLGNLVECDMSHNHISFGGTLTASSGRGIEGATSGGPSITTTPSDPTWIPSGGGGGSDSLFPDDTFSHQSPLRYCPKLESLNLAHNDINSMYLDWNILLGRLRILNLSHNKLQSIEAAELSVISRDLTIDLSFNEISIVHMENARAIIDGASDRSLTVILDSNPLDCSCNLVAFKQFHLKGINLVYKDLQCHEPSWLQGTQFKDVKATDLACSETCLSICECLRFPANQSIVIDCSFRNMSNSSLLTLPGLETQVAQGRGYKFLLNLAGNGISDINSTHASRLSSTIHSINLSKNDLASLAFLNLLGQNNQMTYSLADNKFSCNDCEFHKTLRRHFRQVSDYKNVTCLTEEISEDGDSQRFIRWSVDTFPEADICAQNIFLAQFHWFIVGGVILAIIIVVSAIYARHGWALRAFLYAKGFGCCLIEEDPEDEKGKIYDAFVSYCHKDEDWVTAQLVQRLEEQEAFKLCLHFRDWTPGEWIPDQIVKSVDSSRRTIVILSKNFVESIWSRLEFKAAHAQALNEKGSRLILILMSDDLLEKDIQDDDLKMYMKMNTYLKWSDPWFWHKLKYALPHKKCASVEDHFLRKQQRFRAIQLDNLRTKMEGAVV